MAIRKLQLWCALREITNVVDSWDQDTFEREMQEENLVFRKYLPGEVAWHDLQHYEIKISINRIEVDEEKDCVGTSEKCTKKSRACSHTT